MEAEQITLDEITARRAGPQDLDLVMEILSEATAWLAGKGIHQWPLPPNEHWRQQTVGFVEAGHVYLVFRGGEELGKVRIVWSDGYWEEADGKAGYIHGLAIRSHQHGRGLGAALLSWVEGHIRGQGRRLARLDCGVGNGRLRRYYEDKGYDHCDQVTDRDYRAALYEKRLWSASESS